MATLDLYTKRQSHEVIIDVNGQPVTYKLPIEYTVEELERVLELQIDIDQLGKWEDVTTENGKEKRQIFWETIFKQLLVLFNHYHPELTLDELKTMLTRNEASEVIAFHATKRNIGNEESAPTKKKQTSND